MPRHYTNIPPAANNPAWGEPVFPINTPYPGGYPPADAPRLPGVPLASVAPVKIRTPAGTDETAAAPPLANKIRITTAPEPTPIPEPVVQKTQTARAEPTPRPPSQTKPKDPRMALGKLLFGGSNRRTPVLEWQKLKSRNNKHMSELYRTAVPGGWLISQSETGGLVFLPDPEHEWDGDSLTLYPDNND